MTIFERDKERGEDIVFALSTTNDAGAVKNRPAPQGKLIFGPSDCVASPWQSKDYASSSRLASNPNLSFQNSYYLGVKQ